jgi:hypothetical protein
MNQRQEHFRVAIRKFGPFESAIEKAWQDSRDRRSGVRDHQQRTVHC